MNYYMYSLESIYTTMEVCWTFDDIRERDTTLSITHSFWNNVFSKKDRGIFSSLKYQRMEKT